MGPEMVPDVLEALRDEHWAVRSSAEKALVALGPEAVPALTQALSHEEEQVRLRIDAALTSIRSSSSEAATP
jgi:HEAT repeat protein